MKNYTLLFTLGTLFFISFFSSMPLLAQSDPLIEKVSQIRNKLIQIQKNKNPCLVEVITDPNQKIHGKEFRLINDDSVEAVVQDPRGISRA